MAELLVVGTPIGNLSDLSDRMREALAGCDLIAAEDTRVTMKLLNHLGLHKPMLSCHRHNEDDKSADIVARMVAEDLTVCLTCDAGTPGISDPGVPLVREALRQGVRVTPVCGPSAVTAHLSVCGFDARTFGFYGFPPREKGALRAFLAGVRRTGLPVVAFYESPHRVVRLVEEICAAWPMCMLSVACDLSKRYEKVVTGACENVLAALRENPSVEKGEYSVVCDLSALPALEEAPARVPVEAALLMRLLDGVTVDQAATEISEQYPRNELYRAKLRVRDWLEDQID